MTKEECEVETSKAIMEMRNRIEELEQEKENEQAKKVQVVEHFEAYGQCRDSRRIASLEKENIELKEQIEKMKDCLNKWYKQHNDDDYTETFYDNLLRDTEKCLWGDSMND